MGGCQAHSLTVHHDPCTRRCGVSVRHFGACKHEVLEETLDCCSCVVVSAVEIAGRCLASCGFAFWPGAFDAAHIDELYELHLVWASNRSNLRRHLGYNERGGLRGRREQSLFPSLVYSAMLEDSVLHNRAVAGSHLAALRLLGIAGEPMRLNYLSPTPTLTRTRTPTPTPTLNLTLTLTPTLALTLTPGPDPDSNQASRCSTSCRSCSQTTSRTRRTAPSIKSQPQSWSWPWPQA